MRLAVLFTLGGLLMISAEPQNAKAPIEFEPFVWPSQPPEDCPFDKSSDIVGVLFNGKASDYRLADTWYPSWASDDKLYSPYTDGSVPRLTGGREHSASYRYPHTTGQAIMEGNDPLSLKIYSLGLTHSPPEPYGGRYPSGSLVHNGIWYYGTYCLAPHGTTMYGGTAFNWPWLGPFVGFRISEDFGRSWTPSPHTPEKPLFGEDGMWGHPVKIGAPHFVDFGKNMEHSPDGKAYLVGHGAVEPDEKPRFANLSWISGDQVYLIRVTPSIETINDPSAYEFFAGHDANERPLWTSDFSEIQPLFEWNNHAGCVTVTYNAALEKYLMFVTDGWPTVEKMDTYLLEADVITGPWKLVTYMADFGEQGYFVNVPTKFISRDGRTAWLAYSGNFATDWRDVKIAENPPGSHYGLVMQEITLLDEQMMRDFETR